MEIKIASTALGNIYVMNCNIKEDNLVREMSALRVESADFLLSIKGEKRRKAVALRLFNLFSRLTEDHNSYTRVMSIRDINVHEYIGLHRVLSALRHTYNRKRNLFVMKGDKDA